MKYALAFDLGVEMLVRVKDGYYKGEIREFPSHVAIELIRSGRGENPYAEPAKQPENIKVVAVKRTSRR